MAVEKATTTHILTSPPRHRELVPAKNDFICYKCSEFGTGGRYRCKKCGGDLLLHPGCTASEEEPTTADIASGGEKPVEREARLYIDLAKYVGSPDNRNALDLRCVASTYSCSGIENTLNNSVGEAAWWSNGSTDPSMRECLIFRLPLDFCIVSEIKLEPGKGFDNISYSAKSVRFRMGYSKSSDVSSTSNEHYTWNYTSHMFSMTQEAVLQSFKLPSPVVCIGGVVKIELFDVQKNLLEEEKRKLEEAKKTMGEEKRKLEEENKMVEDVKEKLEKAKKKLEAEKKMAENKKKELEAEKKMAEKEKKKLEEEKKMAEKLKTKLLGEKRKLAEHNKTLLAVNKELEERLRRSQMSGVEKPAKRAKECTGKPSKPKRSPIAFLLFMDKFIKEYQENNRNKKSSGALTKAAGEKWKSMTEYEKAPYVETANKLQLEYEMEFYD